MRDSRWGGVPLPTRRRRRRVAQPLHGSRAAFCVSLDGDPGSASAGSRLFLVSRAGFTRSRRLGHRAMLSARGRAFRAGIGIVLLCGCIDQLLDASDHVGELFGPQSIQLVYGRLGGAQVLEWGGIEWAVDSK